MIKSTIKRFKRNLKKKPTRLKPLSRHAEPRKPEPECGKPTTVKLPDDHTRPSFARSDTALSLPGGLRKPVALHVRPQASPTKSARPGLTAKRAPWRDTTDKPKGEVVRDDLHFGTKVVHEEFCLMAFKKTKNNTYCTLSRLFGLPNTLWTISGGYASGSKVNGRRKTRFTQRMVLKYAFEKLCGLGFKYLVIHCSGSAISKRYLFKNFTKRFKIVLLKDLTGVPHNGCRASNVRRK